MKTRISAIIALALVTSAATVSAQTFSYTSKSNPPTMAVGGVAPDGVPFGAQSVTGTTETMMGDKTVTASFKRISMTQPANDKIFDAHMMCDVTANDGTFTSAWGCNTMGEGAQACVGRLLGQTGVYAKRYGSVTSQNTAGSAVGAGQWFE
jgi:hypothetical protein